MNSYLRSLIATCLAAALLSVLSSGCQTSKGFGKDVEKLGEKIQDKATK